MGAFVGPTRAAVLVVRLASSNASCPASALPAAVPDQMPSKMKRQATSVIYFEPHRNRLRAYTDRPALTSEPQLSPWAMAQSSWLSKSTKAS